MPNMENSGEKKQETYMTSQRKLCTEIEKCWIYTDRRKAKNKLHGNAIINLNTIWEAMKKANGCRELNNRTYSEGGTFINDPEKKNT